MSDQEMAEKLALHRERCKRIVAYAISSTARLGALHAKLILTNSQVGVSDRVRIGEEELQKFERLIGNA